MAAERDTPALFDQIAPSYDLANWVMTGGLWGAWRAAFARHAPIPSGAKVLDVGCGTAELSLLLARMGASEVVGVDLSEGMIARGREKVARSRFAGRIRLQRGDALALPFPDASFDAAASAFVMRNVPDLDRMLAEMTRVVRPGGHVVVMELSHPPSRLVRSIYEPFFRLMPPLVGRLTRGGAAPYAWLPESLARFPGAEELAARMAGAGLEDVRVRRLTAGVVCIHHGARRRGLPGRTPLY
jgi:demethylmenaquinone methyltransferase/2-methoxy-6-polyprenyl-1,4-benzoquinol methylase